MNSSLNEAELKQIFASNLKRYMDKKNINVTQLNNAINGKYSTTRDWCSGVHYPRIDQIQLLADYFGIAKSNLIEERSINMDYLNEDEIRFAKMCVNNIQDKLNAVITELNTREKPYKRYLKEKLDPIENDVKCLLSQVKDIDD